MNKRNESTNSHTIIHAINKSRNLHLNTYSSYMNTTKNLSASKSINN